MFAQIYSVPVEILDDEKTGPQPSIVGSIDKVLKNVNKMDQYQCLQKMICEFMGQAENTVVSAVNNQFAQQVQSPNGPIIQAVTAQLNNPNSNLSPTNQIIQSLGSQFIQQAFQQRPQNQFQTQFGTQQQLQQQQFQQQQFQGQQQFQQFPQQQQFVPQGQQQFQQFPQQQQQFQQFPQQQQQFQQFPQQQFVPQGQQQFQQFPQQQFQQQQFNLQQQQFQQFPNKQFAGQQQQSQNSGGFFENIADSIAGNIAGGLASSFAGNLLSNMLSNSNRGKSAQSRADVSGVEFEDIEQRRNKLEKENVEFKPSKPDSNSRQKRQSSTHGQAIRVMQNLGFDNMGVYPFVRAAIIGHANRAAPTNCKQLFQQCPDSTDQLLNYFNNHNGGLFQNAIPSATDEVSSLFPGLPSIPGLSLPSLPQVAASTIESFANSGSSGISGSNVASSLVQAESGLLSNLVDGLAGMIAGRFS